MKGAQSEMIDTNKVRVSHDSSPSLFIPPIFSALGEEKKRQTDL